MVGYATGTGTLTAYSGFVATNSTGDDLIGSSGGTGYLKLFGNAVNTHNSSTSSFSVGKNGGTGYLTMGRDGFAADAASLKIMGGSFLVGDSSSGGVGTVEAYSGMILANDSVVLGSSGSSINLYGSVQFNHNTAVDFCISKGVLNLGRGGVASDNPALNSTSGAFLVANNGGDVGRVVVFSGSITVGGTYIGLGTTNGTDAQIAIQSGGSFFADAGVAYLGMGYGSATTEWVQEGGTTKLGLTPVWLGCHSAAGGFSANTMRFDGGVFATSGIGPDAACTPAELANIVDNIYFNGGILQTTVNSASFIYTNGATNFNLKIQSNGAKIDSNSNDITIPVQFQEDAGSLGGGLVKLGSGKLKLTADNSYVGATKIMKGILTINVIRDGGISSPIGKSNSNPDKLVIDGGTLRYAGPAVSVNRGFSIGDGTVETDGDLAFTGPLFGLAADSKLTKSGPAMLTLAGQILFTGPARIDAGTLSIDNGLANTLSTVSGTGSLSVGATLTATTLTTTSIRVGMLSIGSASGCAVAVPEPGIFVLLALAGMTVAASCLFHK